MLICSQDVGKTREKASNLSVDFLVKKQASKYLKPKTEETEVSESKEILEVVTEHFNSVSKIILQNIPNTENPKFEQSRDRSMSLKEKNLTDIRGN